MPDLNFTRFGLQQNNNMEQNFLRGCITKRLAA